MLNSSLDISTISKNLKSLIPMSRYIIFFYWKPYSSCTFWSWMMYALETNSTSIVLSLQPSIQHKVIAFWKFFTSILPGHFFLSFWEIQYARFIHPTHQKSLREHFLFLLGQFLVTFLEISGVQSLKCWILNPTRYTTQCICNMLIKQC